jgi:hypothetical protein
MPHVDVVHVQNLVAPLGEILHQADSVRLGRGDVVRLETQGAARELRQPGDVAAHGLLAVVVTGHRALSWDMGLDVVGEQGHERTEVAGGQGVVGLANHLEIAVSHATEPTGARSAGGGGLERAVDSGRW